MSKRPWDILYPLSAFRRARREKLFALRLANAVSLQTAHRRSREEIVNFFNRICGYDMRTCPWNSDEIYHAEDGVAVASLYHPSVTAISPSSEVDLGFRCVECVQIFRLNDGSDVVGRSRGRVCRTCEATLGYVRHGRLLIHPLAVDREREIDRDRDIVRPYSTDVLHILDPFISTKGERLPPKPLWLGVELEVEPRDGGKHSVNTLVAATRLSLDRFAILKKDASIGDNGFEIVTVPATLASHRERWAPFFSGPAKNLQSWKSGLCGMHVHISREAMSTLTLGRFLVLITNPHNKALIEKVAGRYHTDYARMSRKTVQHAKYPEFITQHRDAVCLSPRNNFKTVELRMFRGNSSKLGFMKNLEFTHAAISYCAQASILSTTSADFLAWMDLIPQRSAYPFFTAWAVRENVLRARATLNKEAMDLSLEAA